MRSVVVILLLGLLRIGRQIPDPHHLQPQLLALLAGFPLVDFPEESLTVASVHEFFEFVVALLPPLLAVCLVLLNFLH